MEDNLIENLPIGEMAEAENGVLIERRSFIKTVTMALGAISLSFISTAKSAEFQNETLTYAQFLQEVVPIAKKLMANTSLVGQSKYLLTLASFAVQLENVPVPTMRDSGQGVRPKRGAHRGRTCRPGLDQGGCL